MSGIPNCICFSQRTIFPLILKAMIPIKHTLVSTAMAREKEHERGNSIFIWAPGLALMVRNGHGMSHSNPITTVCWNIFSICRRQALKAKINIYSFGIMSRRSPPKMESNIYHHLKRNFISLNKICKSYRARKNPPKMVHSLGSNRTESRHIFNNCPHFLSYQWHMGRSL